MSIEFLQHVVRLKNIPRSGWISHGISLCDVESVADHSFSVATLALQLASTLARQGTRVDIAKTLRIALIHDVSESLTFDISKQYLDYLGPMGKRLKSRLENKAMNTLLILIKDKAFADECKASFLEYVKAMTLESKLVHAADGLDILIQIIDYERKGYPRQLLEPLWRETSKRLRGLEMRVVDRMVIALARVRRRVSVVFKQF